MWRILFLCTVIARVFSHLRHQLVLLISSKWFLTRYMLAIFLRTYLAPNWRRWASYPKVVMFTLIACTAFWTLWWNHSTYLDQHRYSGEKYIRCDSIQRYSFVWCSLIVGWQVSIFTFLVLLFILEKKKVARYEDDISEEKYECVIFGTHAWETSRYS